jgi:UDP-N-acetyl-D-mannosaminuronic acid transferase (WecB/TagA/CpsF family)
VARAEAGEPQVFNVQFVAGTDAVEALAREAAARDWGLYLLKPAQTSLEDVFVNLTRREETR